MVDKNKLIKITNRDNGTVGYTIPDLNNLRRTFQPNETKEITMEELRKLSYLPGGDVILKNLLVVQDKEALQELVPSVEPEYFYTEDDVKELLLNGSLAQLMDCLDFGPTGVVDLVKDLAVKLEINDILKRDYIFKKTGFNVTKAIEINHETDAVEEESKVSKVRRSAPVKTGEDAEAPKERRVSVLKTKAVAE